MLLRFICCDVFTRIACDLVSKSANIVDLDFVPMLAHVEPAKLNEIIKEKIMTGVVGSDRKYDAVILGFGLCGNAVIGLSCPIPIIIPRAHDCCTIHMGNKDSFIEVFGSRLSSRWCSTGYFERTHHLTGDYFNFDQLANYKTSLEYMSYLEKYDEETADYLWETLHPRSATNECVYIRMDGFEYSDSYLRFKSDMDKAEVELITAEGDISLLKSLVDGDWDEKRFLIVPPGNKISGVYDMDIVMEAEPI